MAGAVGKPGMKVVPLSDVKDEHARASLRAGGGVRLEDIESE